MILNFQGVKGYLIFLEKGTHLKDESTKRDTHFKR